MRRRLDVVQGDRGSVLLETAIAVPVLLAIAVALVWVVSLGAVYVRALDAAQTAARQVARGVPIDTARQHIGAGAELSISEESGLIRARVTQQAIAPVPMLSGISIDISAEAVALAEGAVTP